MSETTLTYRAFWKSSIWNFLLGTLIAIVPAFAFYNLANDYTPRQLGILLELAVVGVPILVAADLTALAWTLRPIRRALSSTASDENVQRGVSRLLALPFLVLPGVFGVHAVMASLILNVLIIWGDRAYGLGIPASQFPLYWLLNLTVVPIGHVVVEYHATERLIQKPLAQLMARTAKRLDPAQLVRLPLASRIFLFSTLLGLAPPVIGGFIAYQRTRAAGLTFPYNFVFQLVAVGGALVLLWLQLLALFSREVGEQTRAITGTLQRIASGDLTAEAPVRSLSEFGEIALAVNSMTSGLRERERLQKEFGVAHSIQQALLPQNFDSFQHFQLTGTNVPCLAVGGDYFDLMQLDPEHLAFVIADVSGKGIGAALVTALLQGAFSTINMEQPFAAVFSHVNRFMCAHSEMNRYATLYLGSFDAAGRLEFINAGHPPPYIIHNGSVRQAELAGSMPVGLFADEEFKLSSLTASPGDTLVLFTDGVTDAANPDGDRFGSERLEQVIALNATKEIKELQDAIVNSIEKFAAGTDQADDITLLVIRYEH